VEDWGEYLEIAQSALLNPRHIGASDVGYGRMASGTGGSKSRRQFVSPQTISIAGKKNPQPFVSPRIQQMRH
jgi:hypothetical protein